MKNNKYLFLAFLFSITLGIIHAQTANWQQTGPVKFPTNKSSQINGIGRVQQLIFHATDPNKMYAVSASGGLFITANGGQSWKVAGTDKMPDMQCASLCVDYTNDQVMYLGSGDPTYHFNSLGIWKSTDGGATWSPSNTGIGNRRAVDILMDPANNKTIIAATDDGIWKSLDAGVTWSAKKSGGVFNNMRFNPADPNIIYAVTSNEFYRSTDRGNSWTKTSLPGAGNTVEGRVGVSKADANVVYVTFVGDFNSNPKTCTPVLRSNNSGQSFTVVKPAGLPNLAGYDENSTGWGWWEFTMTVDPLNANNVWIGTHVVFNSKDGGVTWKRLTSWPTEMHTDFHHMTYSPHDPKKLFNANDGGVWFNTDGGMGKTWKPISDGMGCTENYHAGQSPIKKDRIGIGTQDNGELYYDAGTWYTNRGGDYTSLFAFDYQNYDLIYYPNTNNRRVGVTGGSQGLAFPFTAGSSTIMEFTPLQKNTAFISGSDVWRTDNLSSNPPAWKKLSSFNEPVKAIGISPADANIVYVVTNSGKVYRSDNALSATASFTNVSSAPSSVSSKASIAVVKSLPGVVYLSCNSKVYRSPDKGATWADVSAGLPNTNFIKMYHDIYSTNEGVYIANGMGGVYYKNKNLASWINYSKGLPTICNVTDFMIYNDGNYSNSVLRVAYYGRGVWETPLYDPSTVDVNEINSNDIYSLNVFPNPSKESVSVSFILSKTGSAELALYDMQGKMVKRILNTQQLNAGEHTCPVDISSLESGTYTCKLHADGIVKSKMLVKE